MNNQTIDIQQEFSPIPSNSSNEQLSSVNSILHKPHSTRILNGGGVNDYLPGIMKNRDVIYVNEETLYSDTQVMNIDSVVIATYTAVADLYILGNSQTCLMTRGSTFAYTGCAISRRIPYIISMKNECVKMK